MIKKYLLGVSLLLSSSLSAIEKPNIIYILADDMGVGDVKALNPGAKVKTPNLDGMAAMGMTFSDAHTSSAVCTPTRYGLLTGRYNWRSELKWGVVAGYSRALIAPERDTVADLLKRHGYTTAMIGKSHLGFNWKLKDGTRVTELKEPKGIEAQVDFTKEFTGGPCDFGFDSFYGISASLDFPPYVILKDRKASVIPTETFVAQGFGTQKATHGQVCGRGGLRAKNFTREGLLLDLTETTVDYIKTYNSKNPFFIYMPLPAPHTPILPREQFRGTSEAGIYGDFVHEVDWTVGQVLKALKEKGLAENTLVIFTADNGSSRLGFPVDQEEKYGHKTSYIYKGRKGAVDEGGHRVPFLVQWPTGVKAGTRCDVACSLNDFYATCAEIVSVSVAPDAAEDSTSILPLLKGDESGYSQTKLIHHSYGGDFALRSGDWKLVMGSGKRPPALYNLKNDISEKKNIAKANPEVVERLKKELTELIVKGRSTPGPKQKNDGEQHWRQLHWFEALRQTGNQ